MSNPGTTRRFIRDMTDEELSAERKKYSNVVGKWAHNRWIAVLDEQIRREEASGAV